MKRIVTDIDFWGCTTSLLCAVHCAALPILFSLGALSSHHWMANPIFEVIIIGLTLIFVYTSIIKQYLSSKDNLASLIMALSGFAMIALHHFFSDYATPIVVTGGLLLAAAHFYNITHNHNYANRIRLK